MMKQSFTRKLPVGAEVQPGGGVHFRVWAPRRKKVDVILEGRPGGQTNTPFPLEAEGDGYFSSFVNSARADTLYRFRLDESSTLYPDPVSRFQPDGPHGPSQVIDPSSFRWTDERWPGIRLSGQVIYELHLGTFTHEGTWRAAERELPELSRLGITVLEIMPIAEFPGRFGWGYDGVNLFAPTRLYGSPDDVRHFIDAAHQRNMGVILDVVYNHLGPDGNYLSEFSTDYFTDKYKTDWGKAINFEGPGSAAVREYYTSNAGFWIDEYHFDGLRLDATQNIYDTSKDHILAAINRRVREMARGRSTIVVTENEPQDIRMVKSAEEGGNGFDGMWNDDFHHAALTAITGRGEAYITDYLGQPQEFISMAKRGFLYQGQFYSWQKKRRGTCTQGVPSQAFVTFLENHDQVANTGTGTRPSHLASPGRHRALTALLMLGPGTPMLFQGQEFASSAPFLFFADHNPDLARLVHKGRKEFLAQFPSLAQPDIQAQIDDPANPATFERCKLDFSERQSHAKAYALHADLLRLRREDRVFSAQKQGGIDGAVLGTHSFVLRYFGEKGDDRLLLINLGRDLLVCPAPEPLLAPLEGTCWKVLWKSEEAHYGGDGASASEGPAGWHIPGEAAVVMHLEKNENWAQEISDSK